MILSFMRYEQTDVVSEYMSIEHPFILCVLVNKCFEAYLLTTDFRILLITSPLPLPPSFQIQIF